MTVEEFRATVTATRPPDGLEPALLALWQDARGDWSAAHETAQNVPDPAGAWVHAYLHRKEGDDANAGYWYRRAGKRPATGTLEEEWGQIAASLLGGTA